MAGAQAAMPKRILLVDDEPDILTTVQAILESSIPGVEVDCAPSGRVALDLLQRARFDLVVTDYRMPGMDGAELVGRMRAAWPGMRVVMLTAFVDESTLKEIERRAPGLEILPKPLDIDAFLARIGALLAS